MRPEAPHFISYYPACLKRDYTTHAIGQIAFEILTDLKWLMSSTTDLTIRHRNASCEKQDDGTKTNKSFAKKKKRKIFALRKTEVQEKTLKKF